MRIAVTGSHGLIGSALVESLLGARHDVVKLVRRPTDAEDQAWWDPDSGAIDEEALGAVDGVVHLAGEPIGTGRWNDEKKRRIHDSRVEATRLLASTLAGLPDRPRVLVSGSAIGIYGDRGDEVLTEESSPGDGFMADVVKGWEAATRPAENAGTRVVHLRSGLVLSPEGGSLGRMLPIFKLGVGGPLGSGRQWWSWISIDDEIGLIRHALSNDAVEGPLNATAPNPVRNAELSKALGRVLRRPAVLPAPKLALGVVLGRELAREILGSQRALPDKAERTGYAYRHTDVETALRSVLGKEG